jgi:hypothetical protein
VTGDSLSAYQAFPVVLSKVTPLSLIPIVGTIAVAGGSDGQSILNKFYMATFKRKQT